MTFEELVEVLHGLPGRMVEATVSMSDDRGESHLIASFAGVVDHISRGGATGLPEHWYVRWRENGDPKPAYGVIMVRRDFYEGAEVKGSGATFDEVMAEKDPSGTIWEIIVRQFGLVMTLTAYV